MNDTPQVTARRRGSGSLELDFTLAPDCPWLEGHFPGQPILPGVVQVGWAAHFAAGLLSSDAPPTQVRRLKFKHPIRPGSRLTLCLVLQGNKVRFEYRLWADRSISVSSGVLGFAEAS